MHASRAILKTKANCTIKENKTNLESEEKKLNQGDKLKDLTNFPVEDPIETDNPMQEND